MKFSVFSLLRASAIFCFLAALGAAQQTTVLYDASTYEQKRPTMAQTLGNATNLAAINAVSQPLDADLTSWALITRASGFDAFTATPSSANLRGLVTDETGTSGGLVFAGSPTLITPVLGAATGTSLTLSSLTTGRVTYATTSGLLTDSASLLFDGSKAQIGTTSATRLLLGTATDSSNGSLQLANHTTSAGGIGFGTDLSLFRSTTSTATLQGATTSSLIINSTGVDTNANLQLTNDATTWLIGVNGGSSDVFRLRTSGTDYLTLTTGGVLSLASTTEATTGGAGSLTTAGGIYAAKNIVTAQTIIGGVQSLSGAGAVNVTQLTTEYTSTGAAQALTLADGVAGQIKIIIHGVDGGSGVLTPTTKTGYTTITFTAVGESAMLQFVATRGWIIISLRGAVAA